MDKVLLIALWIIIVSWPGTQIHAQFNENVWCFGDSSGIDFNQLPPTAIKSNVKTRGACTSICDRNGNLLFYASNFNYTLWQQGYNRLGVLYNSSHNVVENGDSLISSSWYNELMLIPYPGDTSKIYLIQMGVTVSTNPGLHYSVIDRFANNGEGTVIQKNESIDNLRNVDGMHAVRHANGRDWWLVSRKWSVVNNTYQFYLVSPSGISLHHTQDIGAPLLSSFIKFKFNPSGTKVAVTSNLGLLELFDFDRCTGTLSNLISIDSVRASSPWPYYWGLEFAPNGDILYCSTLGTTSGASIDTNSTLVQFDLTATDIYNSKVVLDQIAVPYKAGNLELGPDNKIYLTSRFDDPGIFDIVYLDTVNLFNVKHLGVIHQPNKLGTTCDYRPFSFYLGGERTYYGLPNNPNYRAGAIPGTVCDSLGLGFEEFSDAQYFVQVYPNPVLDYASIVVNAPDNLNMTDLQYELFNSVGQRLSLKNVGSQRSIVFDREGLSSGIYFYKLSSKKYGVATGKIIVQ